MLEDHCSDVNICYSFADSHLPDANPDPTFPWVGGSEDGILGHQFEKRLVFCYILQSLLLADFTENHIILCF
jgi:hypothetical protein